MLADHPFFNLSFVSASPSKRNKKISEVLNWLLPYPPPTNIPDMILEEPDYRLLEAAGISIVFSALPSDVAIDIEPILREKGMKVFSNSGAMRREHDVPILIPEANLDSICNIKKQRNKNKGFIITNANCSTTGLAIALAPLKKFEISKIFVSTYQSISGAGYPGVSSADILNNAVPHIPNEEEKIIFELKKILDIDAEIYPHCVRIPTIYGHLENVWVEFGHDISPGQVIKAWNEFKLEDYNLPSLPDKPVVYCEEPDMPQPRMSFYGTPPGMQVFTGRARKQSNLIGFSLLINNIVRGAAGGSILNAEIYHRYLKEKI